MKQLTLRGFDKDLEIRIRDLATKDGISLNRAALRLLRRGAGIDGKAEQATEDVVGNSIDHLIGTWSKAEADGFNKAVEVFETIDESMW